jgi:predicted DsbA family dithiol-disulfide isomerase
MKVEIWSDVVCPWCYVGKRNLEAALAEFPHADQVEIEWRSFELDPTTPARVELSMDEVLSRKYGMTTDEAVAANVKMTELAASVGLEYHLDRVQIGNTFDAHRLIHLANDQGRGGAMKERLLAAYFTEGRAISDHATLIELAGEVGLDPTRVTEMLSGDEYAADVRADEARAVELGSTGVPFFVVDGRFGIPGAQPPDVLLRLLNRVWDSSADAATAGTV